MRGKKWKIKKEQKIYSVKMKNTIVFILEERYGNVKKIHSLGFTFSPGFIIID